MEGPKQQSSAPRDPGRFLTSALHEINNPLESLLNLLYLIEADPGITQSSRDHLKMAEEEVMRVSRIAQAAMKAGPPRERAEEADVAALLASVLDLHKPKLDRHKISVSNRNCEEATGIVYPEQMRQVFSNLLLNAVDAMPKGGTFRAKVSRTKEWCGQHRDGLRITFADTGTGIASSILSRVREPFFTTKGADGNGMGLAIVQEIVARHLGRLKIRSSTTTGKSGTVVSIFIPATGQA